MNELEASPVISSYLQAAKIQLAEANMSKKKMKLTREALDVFHCDVRLPSVKKRNPKIIG